MTIRSFKDSDSFWDRVTIPSNLLIKTGTYTGNGSDPRSITGVGFQPKFVFIGATTGTGDPSGGIWKSADMPTGATGQSASFGDNGRDSVGTISSLDADGFTVRAQKNLNATTYYYVALGGTDIVTGTYTGNGSDNRNITGIGFLPKWVIIQGSTNHTVHKSTITGDSTDNTQYGTIIADLSNAIQALNSDGFQVGTDGTVNTNTATYYYVAIKGSGVNSLTYTGNGSDNRNITGAGFEPKAVFIKGTGTSAAVFRTGEPGDLTSNVQATAAPEANLIQSLSSDGFQVGTDAKVNGNGVTYRAIVLT